MGCIRELRSSTEMCKAGLEGSREMVPCDSMEGYNPNVMQAKSFKGSSGPQSVPANLSRTDGNFPPLDIGCIRGEQNSPLCTKDHGRR